MNSYHRSNHASVGHQSPRYSSEQLCELLRREEDWVTDNWLTELVTYGVLTLDCDSGRQFSEAQLERARNAARIQRELLVNPPGIALALELRERIVALEGRVAELEFRVWAADDDRTYFYH